MTRTAGEIGAGLAAARAPRPIALDERIHVIGVAGAGASAAALVAAGAGAIVSGCDAGGPSPYSAAVVAAGIHVSWEHDPSHVTASPTPDRLAVSKAVTAVAPGHPELVAAATRGIPIEPWQQLVADAAIGRTVVAVAGTHGKSTTAGWLTHCLVEAGLDPTAFVGALLPPAITGGLAATARLGASGPFVIEADEYAGNFDPYRPTITVLTTIDWDHPDVFADRAAVIQVFRRWLLDGASAGSTLVANVGDPGVSGLLDQLGVDWPGSVIRTAVLVDDPARSGANAALSARVTELGSDHTTIELAGLGKAARTIRLPSAGRHNVANALGVAGAAQALDLAPESIAQGLATFPGIGRRLERKGEASGVSVYDDYAHHPIAISATIESIRQREPGRRLWAVYEPLTFHRTAALLEQFAGALAAADAVAIADIWPGRDIDRTIVSASDLAAAVSRRRSGIPVEATGSVEATASWLATRVHAGDAVLVMGGGRSYRIGELLLERLGTSVNR